MRALLFLVLFLLFVLRHDLWWWDRPDLVLGLPIGLLYHALFCLAVSVVMALLVRHAWPDVDLAELAEDEAGESP
ncbi:MAG: hypothetical protein OES25_00750 [Acidobacteriota bacterium]|nr:hypothetical protein [Acidobacteriota bacterium]